MENRESDNCGYGPHVCVVRNTPENLGINLIKKIFSYFGATNVARKRKDVYVSFNDEIQAKKAKSQLHRVKLLNKTLNVELLSRFLPGMQPSIQKVEKVDTSSQNAATGPPSQSATMRKSTQIALQPQFISPDLGVNYPFSPTLKYNYPAANSDIVDNISQALVTVPDFYTQVLHLMNKMNLPAPFNIEYPQTLKTHFEGGIISTNEVCTALERTDGVLDSVTKEANASKIKGSEAASSTDEEEKGAQSEQCNKRAKVTHWEPPVPVNLPAVIKKRPPIIEIKLKSKILDAKANPPPTVSQVEGSPDLSEKMPQMSEGSQSFASKEEILAGKLSVEELEKLSAYKNYSPGNPSRVLYLKNLAKDVLEEDLKYIFGGFLLHLPKLEQNLEIKLMKEGRMKGQAFIAFPSNKIAEEALECCNGFSLKGRPVIIQFGKGPKNVDV